MIVNLLQIIVFLMPAIGILAGLSLSVSVAVFFTLLTIKFHKSLKFYTTPVLSIFFVWCFLACFWSPNISYSLLLFTYVFLLSFLLMSIMHSLDDSKKEEIRNIVLKPLSIGLLTAIIIFMAEYLTLGFFSLQFKAIVQGKEGPFALYWLDRGCSFVSTISWVIIGYFLHKKRYLIVISFTVIMFFLLMNSDSFASFVGFSLALISFIILYLSNMRLGFLVRIAFASYIFIMPIASFYQNPHALSDGYSIPESSKHRLFIWNFVANKAVEKPVLGYGFASSRYVAESDDVVEYKEGAKWHLLPMHPHNNSLQSLLEMGVIGLLLFVVLVDNILKNIILKGKDLIAKVVSISCFINYFFVGMVSFGMWQIWWFSSAIFVALMINIFFCSSKTDS